MADTTTEFRGTLQSPESKSGLVGPLAVALALLSSLTTFVIFTGVVDVDTTETVILSILIINVALAVTLLMVIVWEVARLVRARRDGQAGARLHARVVTFFSVIAAAPAIFIAIVSTVTLERGLNPWFSGALSALVLNADTIARDYQQQLCQNVGREMRLVAAGVDAAKRDGFYDQRRDLFRNFLTSRAGVVGFPYARILKRDGTALESADIRIDGEPDQPSDQDFIDAGTAEPPCLIAQRFVGSLIKLANFEDGYLFVARPVDERALNFPRVAQRAIEQYRILEAQRTNVVRIFGMMFALIALTLLLSAVWLGLNFATRLVTPIRRLIEASDQVGSGNLYVQVAVRGADGEIGHLGTTFNNMTAQLRQQQNRLVGASDLIDRRRRFMEAVLSGVSAGVLGFDGNERITIANPVAEQLLKGRHKSLLGASVVEVVPELANMVGEAMSGTQRLVQGQVELSRGGRDRTLFVRVTSERTASETRGFVVTLDDITELVSAQRTSAWADVARRIAHEIKNPLTPIQLSAERIKRKYGKVIVEDREVFEQCTNTIVRQVDDIRRMVDEFSSFARMPKPAPDREDLADVLRQTLFMMRVGHGEVEFVDRLPSEPLIARFDRRLVGQAVQNILKNAAEATEGQGPTGEAARVELSAVVDDEDRVVIEVTDNGRGFPTENRQRLLEPYMTTRESGTGLGLAIVAKIFEEHGGGIELLDNPAVVHGGQGARVRLWFPRGAEPGPPSPSDLPDQTYRNEAEKSITA